MGKAYYFDSDIDTETVNKLLEFCNGCSDKTVIYFSSDGGTTIGESVLIDYLSNKDDIELVGLFALSSSAFDVFMRTKAKKRLIKPVYGMIHLPSVRVERDTNDRYIYDSHKYSARNMKSVIEDDIAFYKKLGVTAKEIIKIRKGENVYFEYDRMVEFMNKSIEFA